MSKTSRSRMHHPYAPNGILAVMVPYGNLAFEWEVQVLLDYPNFALTTRLAAEQGMDLSERLGSYFDPLRLRSAMDTFGSTPIDCVGIGCSAASYFIGYAREIQVFEGLGRDYETQFTWSTKAMREGLESIGSRRMSLISPYPTEITQRCVEYWKSCGFEVEDVTQIANANPGFHPVYTVTPAVVQTYLDDVTRRSRSPVVITGTGLSTLPAVARTLLSQGAGGPPILSANLCLVRSMLKSIGKGNAGAEDWFTSGAKWLNSAARHSRMQEFLHA